MSAGITRIHGSAEVGTSLNVTGRKSTFFGGYQPLFVKIQTKTSVYDWSGSTVGGEFEQVIRACETVGTVVGYGNPSTTDTANSCTAIVMFDAGTLNQGDGTGGQSGATTGLAALKAALADAGGVTAGDFAVTTYTGFAGASFAA